MTWPLFYQWIPMLYEKKLTTCEELTFLSLWLKYNINTIYIKLVDKCTWSDYIIKFQFKLIKYHSKNLNNNCISFH